jgi:hypothetical protein
MDKHTIAYAETHEALAIVNDDGSTFKVTYLEDARGWSMHHGAIPVAGKSKILAQREALDGTTAKQGMLIKVVFGTKRDRRFGDMPGSVLGFRAA